MIRDRNIVCVASNWFEHPTSKHHVMRLLARENRVIWVNYHASRRPTLGRGDGRMILRRVRQALAGPRRAAPGLEVLSPLLLPFPESPAARFVNARLLVRQIRQALRRCPAGPTQLWLFTPDAPELARLLATERTVYYCVDDFAAFSGFNADLMTRLERETCDLSDVVIATSQPLHEHCRAMHPNVHFVPHGVDVEHFASASDLSRADIPADLRDIPRPVLGYFGLISDYVDLDLLAEAARRRPDWSFVLLGAARCSTDVLSGLANVHLLGGKAYEDLPRYCRGFDAALIPFHVNRLTHAVNPIKLREYLAAGLPVVSTPMPAVEAYAPAVRTARNVNEFVEACAAALTETGALDASGRRELIEGESWGRRVELLARIVEEAAPILQRGLRPQTGGAKATRQRGNKATRQAGRLRHPGDGCVFAIREEGRHL